MSVLIGERRGEGQPHDEQCSRRNSCNSHGFSLDMNGATGVPRAGRLSWTHFEALAHRIDP
jgi:hypothetical protein